MQERWKKIPSHSQRDSYYSVSTLGRVRSDRYDRLLTLFKTQSGSLNVSVRFNRRVEGRQVAHLVVEAFLVGPTVAMKRVRHKDGDKTNCHLENLEVLAWSLRRPFN